MGSKILITHSSNELADERFRADSQGRWHFESGLELDLWSGSYFVDPSLASRWDELTKLMRKR